MQIVIIHKYQEYFIGHISAVKARIRLRQTSNSYLSIWYLSYLGEWQIGTYPLWNNKKNEIKGRVQTFKSQPWQLIELKYRTQWALIKWICTQWAFIKWRLQKKWLWGADKVNFGSRKGLYQKRHWNAC